ncbi:hypothetical protein JOC25_003293 [Solibacillus kalamii]|uniref:MucB/RseB N-terminal domain-containing protein n=1 Tax=Solibacillus kalamii TaxID=1748298 RepID=A0ABX3ZD94_9BACL|nr:hypothetical protein [Solibacillus kalamii]MBM7666771.1 hypothetical protein [Solibacillus kalamii]OUZ37668.1 hypothetical protein CBM15_16915 [Solibacillus kalamii]
MTSSQVKQAIDETIGSEPLMNEAFVQKLLDGKQHRKKRMPFMQPAIVLLFLFTIGGILYFMPLSDERLAEDSEEETMYLAKSEHLEDMIVQNRKESNILYVFNNGTLHYRSDTRLYLEKPKSEDEKPYSGELIEETYTNIQIKTKDNQYFITGDDGFSWTLTRTAPRILVDDKGTEYTIPFAFEDIPQISDVLLVDDIQSLKIYKIGGTGTKVYLLEEDINEVKELFSQATVNEEHQRIGLDLSELMIEIEYKNGKRERLELWLKGGDKESYVLKNDVEKNTWTIFEIPKALANHFRKLVNKIEEIDNAK